jgi:hypothetical protein
MLGEVRGRQGKSGEVRGCKGMLMDARGCQGMSEDVMECQWMLKSSSNNIYLNTKIWGFQAAGVVSWTMSQKTFFAIVR